MNSITIIGRLTQDPELRALPSGDPVCQLRLAVDGMGRGGRDEVGYINVSVFGKAGEAAHATSPKAGSSPSTGACSTANGRPTTARKRHDYEIVGNVEFLAAPAARRTAPATRPRPKRLRRRPSRPDTGPAHDLGSRVTRPQASKPRA